MGCHVGGVMAETPVMHSYSVCHVRLVKSTLANISPLRCVRVECTGFLNLSRTSNYGSYFTILLYPLGWHNIGELDPFFIYLGHTNKPLDKIVYVHSVIVVSHCCAEYYKYTLSIDLRSAIILSCILFSRCSPSKH